MTQLLPCSQVNRRKAYRPARLARQRTSVCVLALCVAILGVPRKCAAQDDSTFHSCTLNIGGGWTEVAGKDASSLDAGWNFQAGIGFAVTGRPAPGHRWSAFINANFMFDQLGVSQAALQQAQTLNPTNIGLLEATSAKAKFYSTTLDPTFRFPVSDRATAYVFGGFGWFRRTLDFTGASVQGSLLQPGSPVVFGDGGNSGAFDVGGGVNFRLSRRTGSMDWQSTMRQRWYRFPPASAGKT